MESESAGANNLEFVPDRLSKSISSRSKTETNKVGKPLVAERNVID